jgi:hypothetical protein
MIRRRSGTDHTTRRSVKARMLTGHK